MKYVVDLKNVFKIARVESLSHNRTQVFSKTGKQSKILVNTQASVGDSIVYYPDGRVGIIPAEYFEFYEKLKTKR